jgi:hypothetical protein
MDFFDLEARRKNRETREYVRSLEERIRRLERITLKRDPKLLDEVKQEVEEYEEYERIRKGE